MISFMTGSGDSAVLSDREAASATEHPRLVLHPWPIVGDEWFHSTQIN